jgi:hypothetical protein
MTNFDVIDRPQSRARGANGPFVDAVIASAESGKAVRVPLPQGKATFNRLQNAARLRVGRKHPGLVVRTTCETDYSVGVFWCEKRS